MNSDEELLKKCEPIEIKSRIVFYSNEQYGFGKIIRKMAFYPSFLPICAYFEHSSPPFYDEIWELTHQFLTNIFFHRKDFVKQWNQKFKGKARTFKSPFVWYKEKNKISTSKEAKGSVYFIHHSREGVDRLHNQDKIIHKIESLPEEMKPVALCFYYLDILKGLHVPYQELGYDIVTVGNKNNPNFIKNFYNLLKNYKFMITNSIGGHILFATNFGVPVSYFEELEPIHKSNIEGFDDSRVRLIKSKVYQEAKMLFKGIHIKNTKEQLLFSNKMLGVEKSTNRLKISLVLYISFVEYVVHKLKKNK